MYCYHLRDSSALSNVPAPSNVSKELELFDREGGFTRKGWIGWILCTSLGSTLHKKAIRCPKKLGCALVTGTANRKVVAGGTFITTPRQL